MSSYYQVSLLARQLGCLHAEVTTCLEYHSTHYHRLTDMTCYYDSESHFCLYKTWDKMNRQEILTTYAFEHNTMRIIGDALLLKASAPIWLRAKVDGDRLHQLYSVDGDQYRLYGDIQGHHCALRRIQCLRMLHRCIRQLVCAGYPHQEQMGGI